MNFFLDTSALFKLFVHEDQSDHYLSLLEDVPSIFVSAISWVEFHSALRKRLHSKELSRKQRDDILGRFKIDWDSYSKVKVDDSVLDSAANLVGIHALKTLDSIQLASAIEVSMEVTEPFVFLQPIDRCRQLLLKKSCGLKFNNLRLHHPSKKA